MFDIGTAKSDVTFDAPLDSETPGRHDRRVGHSLKVRLHPWC